MQFLEEEYDRIYNQVKGRARAEGAYTHDAWRTIVDDVVDTHEEFGEVNEEGLQNLKDILNERFEEFKGGLKAM